MALTSPGRGGETDDPQTHAPQAGRPTLNSLGVGVFDIQTMDGPTPHRRRRGADTHHPGCPRAGAWEVHAPVAVTELTPPVPARLLMNAVIR
jgi:hypothetical protein